MNTYFFIREPIAIPKQATTTPKPADNITKSNKLRSLLSSSSIDLFGNIAPPLINLRIQLSIIKI